MSKVQFNVPLNDGGYKVVIERKVQEPRYTFYAGDRLVDGVLQFCSWTEEQALALKPWEPTREELTREEKIELFGHFLDGVTIQSRLRGMQDMWQTITLPRWDFELREYRAVFENPEGGD